MDDNILVIGIAGGTGSGTLRLFFLGNGHTKHLASPVGEET